MADTHAHPGYIENKEKVKNRLRPISGQDEWGAAAEHWARAAEQEEVGASGEAAEWMLRVADLRPGERVLEVAGGAGRVGLQAAGEVSPDGTVLCSDFSAEMVRVARERFEPLG